MIVVDKVTKFYGAHAAVRDLSFEIHEGECVGFLGLNGAGKTTTLRILSCLSLPTSGRVTIGGLDVEDEPHEIRKLIGFLPDRPPVYPEMTVSSYLRFAGKLRQMDSATVEARLPEVIGICGLAEVADEVIGTLSHGYTQRVGIAQAIVHKPALLILDEPIQGLDPVQIVEMREMIRALRGHHTILLSTHILSEIQQTCDRIMMLHQGRITAQGSEDDLARRFASDQHIELEVNAPAEGEDALANEAIQKLLRQMDGVSQVEVRNTEDPSCRQVEIAARRDVRSEAAKVFVDAGYGLLRLERSASGLERIFIQLSEGKMPPAAVATKLVSSFAPPAAVAGAEGNNAGEAS